MTKEIDDFIAEVSTKKIIREEKIYLSDEGRERLEIDAHYFVREVIDPVITIREEDLKTALKMAWDLGFKQANELN